MKLATVTSTLPLEVIRAGEQTAVPVSITAVPSEALTVGDQVQVELVSRQLVLFARTGGANLPPPAGSITYSMLGPAFAATLAESAGNVVIAQAAVQAGMIDLDAIDGTNIQDDAISTPHLQALSITGAKIVADTIQGSHIASFSITAADAVFQAAAIASADIASLVADKIAAGTITGQEIVVAGGVAGILRSSGFVAGSAGWRLMGDGSFEANTGTFRGALSAATGTFAGSLSAAGGTFSGNLSGAGGTFSGTISANQISGGTISGVTITGSTIQTAASGQRVLMNTSGQVLFYDSSGGGVGTLQGQSSLLDFSGAFHAATALSTWGSISAYGASGHVNVGGNLYTDWIYGEAGGTVNIGASLNMQGNSVSGVGALTMSGSLTLSSGLVTRGVVDSGGAGFRLLRVPN